MMLSSIFNKVQKLDHKIKILSEMTPGIDSIPISITDYQYRNNNQKEKNEEIIIKKVNQLEKLVSHLKV